MQAPRQPDPVRKDGEPSEFLDALKKGALVGAVLLVLIIPLHMANKQRAPEAPPPVAVAPHAPYGTPQARDPAAPPADGTVPAIPGLRLADFRGEQPTPDARLVANWASATRDHGSNAFVIVDKKDARVYVFGPDGRLRDSAPALLGSARGDDSYPGIGDKPLKDIQPHEKTTPAGRFIAEPGQNANREDIVWVDYDAAVSMHRIRPTVAQERRLERLATLTVDDNRISFGCINLPVSFYEDVLRPTVQRNGAVIYVLPDVKTSQQVFGAYDVTDPMQVASHQARGTKPPGKAQKVALQAQR